MTRYTLSRFVDGPLVSHEGTYETVEAAKAALEGFGYDVRICEEDADNPDHWDVFAVRGRMEAEVFTIEPA